MRRPFLLFVLFAAAYLAVIGCSWLPLGATAGELPGHAAKILDILRLLKSGHFAWSPDYLGGSPTAALLSFALSVPVYAPGLLLFSNPIAAMKVTGMILLALGGFAAFAFGRRLDRSGWSGFAVGCAYLLSPQLLMRLGWQEHMTIVAAVPFVPLAFFALLRVAERGSPWDALLLAATYSAALLAWSKMGATLAIPLAVFALWLFLSRPECRSNLVRGAAWAVPLTLLLGVVPLLPLLRERGLMTVFELDPFPAWQSAYSAKSATGWIDRAGDLFKVLPPQFRIDRGAYYLGAVGLAALGWTVWRTWRAPRLDRRTAAVRLFGFIALLMFWISMGPRSVFQGHLELLGVADVLPDILVPVHWLLLAAEGVFLYWCLPRGRWRPHAFVLVFGIFLFVPLFRLLEPLPLFADLRAPDSFWILNGTFSWCVASGMAVVGALSAIPRPAARTAAALAALALAAVDFSPYFKAFHAGALQDTVFEDYGQAVESLAAGTGRVQPISGRYFYLDLPLVAGRPLSTEALNHYLLPADTARLQRGASISATDTLTYMRLSGIGSVMLDLSDKDVSRGTERWFRSLLPVRFENEGFAVLDNPRSLYPAFFGEAFAPAASGYQEYIDALKIGANHFLTIAGVEPGEDPAGLPGSTAIEAARESMAPDFLRLDTAAPRTADTVRISAPGKSGWIVLSESWHPDWTASVDGAARRVYRAAGAFPGVPVAASDREVEFRFDPPAWYAVCLAAGGGGWILSLAALALVPLVPPARKKWASDRDTGHAGAGPSIGRPLIERPTVIVPTYNESGSITDMLDALLAADRRIHVLVVDDASPDGTAERVRRHVAFSSRVHLLSRSGKLGLGSAYREGFRWAIDRGHDVCIEIDADFSHDPKDIPRLLDAIDAGHDAAIGSRYLDGVRVINWPEHRLLLSSGASRFVRLVTGLPLTDATSGFKALRSAALERIDWTQLRADGYGFQIELHWLLWAAGFRIVEVPIVFTERRVGQTKMSPGIAIEAVRRVVQLGLRNPSRGKHSAE